MERRVRSDRVWRRDRGVHWGCPRLKARLSAPVGGAADPGAVRRGVLSAANTLRKHRRAQDPAAPIDRRRQCRDHRSRLARGFCRGTPEGAQMALGFWRLAFLGAMLTGIAVAAAAGRQTPLDVLVQAYPDFLAGYDGSDLIWRGGARGPVCVGEPRRGVCA